MDNATQRKRRKERKLATKVATELMNKLTAHQKLTLIERVQYTTVYWQGAYDAALQIMRAKK